MGLMWQQGCINMGNYWLSWHSILEGMSGELTVLQDGSLHLSLCHLTADLGMPVVTLQESNRKISVIFCQY